MSPTVPPTSTITTPCAARSLVATEPGFLARDARDLVLDLVRDVRMTWTVPPRSRREDVPWRSRSADDGCGDVRCLREVLVDERPVVAEVKVGFGAVIGHEDFAVLVGDIVPVSMSTTVELQDALLDVGLRGCARCWPPRCPCRGARRSPVTKTYFGIFWVFLADLAVARAGGGSCWCGLARVK